AHAVVDIAAVMRFYFDHHVKSIRDKAGPKRAFKHLTAYLASVDAAGKVADLTLAHQDGFMKWCRDQRKLSNKTISTYLSYIKAALRFCSRPHLIRDGRGQEREVQVLAAPPPHIDDGEERVTKITKLPQSEPRKWRPTDAQLAAMFDAIEEG